MNFRSFMIFTFLLITLYSAIFYAIDYNSIQITFSSVTWNITIQYITSQTNQLLNHIGFISFGFGFILYALYPLIWILELVYQILLFLFNILSSIFNFLILPFTILPYPINIAIPSIYYSILAIYIITSIRILSSGIGDSE